MRRTRVNTAIDRLQEFLLAMSPGDEVSPRQAADLSGLDDKECHAILDELMRVGLMVRLQQDAYVRCRLTPTEQHFG
jgi:hypothetical protein